MANSLIENKIKDLLKEEQKDFMVAYAATPQDLHGYLSALPQKVKIWGKNITPDEYEEFKKHYPVSQWISKIDGKEKDSGLFLEIQIPFLGVDGCLAWAKKDCPNTDIKFEVMHISDVIYVKASVTLDKNHSEGIAVLDRRDNSRKDAIEIAASNALRKALSYLGYGRYATYSTPYGGNKLVEQFREFVINQSKASAN